MLAGLLALLLLAPYAVFVAVGWIGIGLYKGGEWFVNWLRNYGREVRLARLRTELDAKRDELAATALRLQGELGVHAHAARQALIRASFEASQRDAVNGTGR